TNSHSYQVQVTASDGTNATPKTITITLTDVNDNAPAITTPALQSISEGKTQITSLTATDADTVGGPVTFAITGGADQALFGLSAGKLVFTTAKDYETDAHSYEVEVTASDGLNTTAKTFTVLLTNLNEAPSGADKAFTIDEDATLVFATADFGFTDTSDSPANNLQVVEITTLPPSGTLFDNGVPVTTGQFVAAAAITPAPLP